LLLLLFLAKRRQGV